MKGGSFYADDTTVLKNGKGTFKGKKKLEKGIYFIISDGKRYDIIMGDNQRFGVMADTSDFMNRTRFVSSPENEIFYSFQRYNAGHNTKLQQLGEQFKKASGNQEKDAIRNQIQVLEKERLEYTQKLIDDHQGWYVAKFLNSLIPMESNLPDYPRNAKGQITDSTYVFRWYRAHFFDKFNIYDPEMLRTPLYEDKILEYQTKVIQYQLPDTICADLDKVLTKAKTNDEIFQCVLITIFNYYVKSNIMVHENVWVHLAEKWYIPFASWSKADYIETLKKEVAKRKSNLIGLYAPPMEMLMALPPEHFKAAALDTAIKNDLHAGVMIDDFRKRVKGKYIAILFWDYGCTHCKKTIQDLFRIFEEYKDKGLQVITVQTVVDAKEAKGKWIDYVNEHNLFGWINAWSPYSHKYKELYDIYMTPRIYLLDEHDMIIAKLSVAEQVKEVIDLKQIKK